MFKRMIILGILVLLIFGATVNGQEQKKSKQEELDNLVATMIKGAFATGTVWQASAYLDKVKKGMFGNLKKMAILLAFLSALFQFVVILFRTTQTLENPAKGLYPLMFKVVLVFLLLGTPFYDFFMKSVIAKPADLISGYITSQYIKSLATQWQAVIKPMGGSKTVGFITAALSGQLVQTLVASLIYVIAAVTMIIASTLQGILFLYLYYLGPICIAFWLNDVTSGVTKAWLNQSLTIAWVSLFGSTAYLVITTTGVFGDLAIGGGWLDVITTIVYGTIAIILSVMAYPIASHFFGGSGALGMIIAGGQTVAATKTAKAQGFTLGGAMQGAGVGLSAIGSKLGGSAGSVVSGLGGGLSSIGEKTSNVSTGKGFKTNNQLKSKPSSTIKPD